MGIKFPCSNKFRHLLMSSEVMEEIRKVGSVNERIVTRRIIFYVNEKSRQCN